jgi:hypothetical protein
VISRRATALEDLDDDHAAAEGGTGVQEYPRLTVAGAQLDNANAEIP